MKLWVMDLQLVEMKFSNSPHSAFISKELDFCCLRPWLIFHSLRLEHPLLFTRALFTLINLILLYKFYAYFWRTEFLYLPFCETTKCTLIGTKNQCSDEIMWRCRKPQTSRLNEWCVIGLHIHGWPVLQFQLGRKCLQIGMECESLLNTVELSWVELQCVASLARRFAYGWWYKATDLQRMHCIKWFNIITKRDRLLQQFVK